MPKSLLKEAKIIAIKRDKSLSQLLVDALKEIVHRNQEYEGSKHRHKMILEKGLDLGTRGDIRVKREELHERG